MRQWLGSIAFNAFLFLSVPFYAGMLFLVAPFGYAPRYRCAILWADAVLYMLRALCRLTYAVEGREHLPARNSIVLIKHSSAWETLAQIQIFPPQTWVLKRELLWVPVFGWALWLLKPIAIDRRGGGGAVQQVLDQGRRRLDEGLWVTIFPEGTRMPIGQTRRYGLSGALLACEAGRPIVPVAHNAGYFWPRRGWLKRPGTIRVMIGAPIPTAGVEPRQVNEQVQRWIEEQVGKLGA